MNSHHDEQKGPEFRTQAQQARFELSELERQKQVTKLRGKFEKGQNPLEYSSRMFTQKAQKPIELDFQSSPDSVAQGPFGMEEAAKPSVSMSPVVSAPRFGSISQALIPSQNDTFIERLRDDLTQNYIDFLEGGSTKELVQEKIETVFNMFTDVVSEQISVLSNKLFSSSVEDIVGRSASLADTHPKSLDLGDL